MATPPTRPATSATGCWIAPVRSKPIASGSITSHLTTPHRLDDGRLFYADTQVTEWPREMSEWIGGDQIYWRRDDMLAGYVLVRNGGDDDE